MITVKRTFLATEGSLGILEDPIEALVEKKELFVKAV
jgi:hypothetical protein